MNLAMLRIVLFAVLGYEAIALHPVWFTTLPRELLRPPAGGNWLTRPLLLNPTTARIGQVILVASCAAAVVGVQTRAACITATLSALYVLGLPELWGKVNHYMHLLWFAGLLSVSPCGDALTWERGGQGMPPPDARYGRPLRYAWILMGLVYLFPGLWKLSLGVGSSAWWAGDNLKWQMYRKWVETGYVIPALRVDQWPVIYRLGGLATVCFEIGFLPLVCWRRTRLWTAVAGIGFHVMCAITMLIWFWILPVLYVMFVDWDALLRRLGWRPRTGRPRPSFHRWAVPLVGTALLCAVAMAGLRGTESWPFAAYPTFAFRAEPVRVMLDLRLVEQGREVPLAPATASMLRDRFENSRWARLLERILWTPDAAARASMGRALVSLLRKSDPSVASADSLRIYRVVVPLDPAQWDEPRPSRFMLSMAVSQR